MRKTVLLAVALVLIASACASASEQPVTTTTAAVSSEQTETNWCNVFTNYPTIAEEAILLQVDGYQILEAERDRILTELGEAFLDNFLGGFTGLEWKDANEAGFAAACSAAYAAR